MILILEPLKLWFASENLSSWVLFVLKKVDPPPTFLAFAHHTSWLIDWQSNWWIASGSYQRNYRYLISWYSFTHRVRWVRTNIFFCHSWPWVLPILHAHFPTFPQTEYKTESQFRLGNPEYWMKFKVCIIRPLLPPTPVSFKLPFSLKPEDCKYLWGRLRAISTTSLTACLHGHKIKTFQIN